MAFFFRRLRANQNGNAGDGDSEYEGEEVALLEDASDSNSSGERKIAAIVL